MIIKLRTILRYETKKAQDEVDLYIPHENIMWYHRATDSTRIENRAPWARSSLFLPSGHQLVKETPKEITEKLLEAKGEKS